ncbi:fimbrial protein [Erwinia psidii]|nr:fimbrial protein [Erwinia psidii]
MLQRKTLITLIMLAGIGTVFTSGANDDGTIHFIGTVSASACSVDSTAGTSGRAGTVNFGVVSSKTLAAVGNSTTAVPFSIVLTDCAVSSAPTITFNGESVSSASGDLFATQVTGVGIQIEDADATSTIYRPGIATANTGLNVLNINDGEDQVPSATAGFRAYLVRASGTGTVTGDIDTDVTFTINYTES